MKLEHAIENFNLAKLGVISPGTIGLYNETLSKLANYLGDIALEDITLQQLRQWRATLINQSTRWQNSSHPTEQGGLSSYTIHRHLRAIRTFLNWCVTEGLLETSPAARLDLPKLPKNVPPGDIPPGDIERLLECAKDNPRDYAIIIFLTDTGARVGGLCNLRLDNLHIEDRYAVVIEKGDKARTVFFGPQTALALKNYLATNPKHPNGFVFSTEYGRPIKRGTVYQMLKRVAKRADVKKFNPHGFRHALAHRAVDRGCPMEELSEVMGHSSPTVTRLYYSGWTEVHNQKIHKKYCFLDPVQQ